MQIIKKYGRSVVGERDGSVPSTRKLQVRQKFSQNTNQADTSTLHEVPVFARSNPDIVIAQWISVIDKIVKKPSEEGYYPSKGARAFRDRLGEACWKLILDKKFLGEQISSKDKEHYHAVWTWKLHPYEFKSKAPTGRDSKKKYDKKLNTGRLCDIFISQGIPHDFNENNHPKFDFKQIAKKIEQHLYQKRLRHANADGEDNRGFIERRANSIAKNTHGHNFQKRLAAWQKNKSTDGYLYLDEIECDDFDLFCEFDNDYGNSKLDLAKEIYNANQISLASTKQSRNGDIINIGRNLFADEAIKIIHARYKNIFWNGGKNRVLTRKEIETDPSNHAVLKVFDDIRQFYKTLLKVPRTRASNGKAIKKDITHTLPCSNAILCSKIRKKRANRATNELIRLGRVLHYHYCVSSDFRQSGKPIWSDDLICLRDSYYWSSKGQSDIKRTEAFIRVWRSSVSLSISSLGNWLLRGFENQNAGDYLTNGDLVGNVTPVKNAITKFNQDDPNERTFYNDFEKRFWPIFGEQSSHFEQPRDADMAGISALNICRIIRNETFHFRDRKGFSQTVEAKLHESSFNIFKKESGLNGVKPQQDICDAFDKKLDDIWGNDLENWQQRHFHITIGAGIHQFLTQANHFNSFLEEAYLSLERATSDLTLPKFQKLLTRFANTPAKHNPLKHFQLPEPANKIRMEPDIVDDKDKNAWYRAKFQGLRLLYEGRFKNWLEKEVSAEQINNWSLSVIEMTDKLASDINKVKSDENDDKIRKKFQNFIKAKASQLSSLSEKQNFRHFLAELTAETASEMQVQNGYFSDGEKARKQAEWIENFKKDVILHAFKAYLDNCGDGVKKLLSLDENSIQYLNTDLGQPSLYQSNENDSLSSVNHWVKKFYFYLHLIPVDEANLLYQQFLKWGALEQKFEAVGTEEDKAVAHIKQAMMLYIKMHDAQFTATNAGAAIANADFDIPNGVINTLFASRNIYENYINPDNQNSNKLAQERMNIKRGVREVMRFGTQDALTRFRLPKLIGQDLAYLKNETEFEKIRKYQLIRDELLAENKPEESKRLSARKSIASLRREKWEENKYEEINDCIAQYKEVVLAISDHKFKKNKADLTDAINLNRFMMELIARLVDFAGLWERDHYFMILALIKLNEKDVSGVINNSQCRYFIKRGDIPFFDNILDNDVKSDISKYGNLSGKATRNKFDHFNMLQTGNDENQKWTITSLMNDARHLLKYDRKLKNAVSKAIRELAAREGVDIKFEIQQNRHGHKLSCSEVTSKPILHLANTNLKKRVKGRYAIIEPGFSEDYILVVKRMFG